MHSLPLRSLWGAEWRSAPHRDATSDGAQHHRNQLDEYQAVTIADMVDLPMLTSRGHPTVCPCQQVSGAVGSEAGSVSVWFTPVISTIGSTLFSGAPVSGVP